jgi:flagellar hook-associated protein flgK
MANSMGSLFIGASGLQVSQNAMNATANNLSNVDTKGYVRERVLQADRHYDTFDTTAAIGPSQSGLGVSIGDVIHARDVFLDKTFRTESGRQAFYSSTSEAITEVETLFQELEGTAFQEVLMGESGLWVAFEEFAKDPSDSVNQNLVVQKAGLFARRAKAVYQGLEKYQSKLNTQISDAVDRVNDLGNTLRQLNIDIMTIESGGIETAMNLRDQRDLVLDELAQYGTITYKELANGEVKVNFEGVSFVDEMRVYEIGKQTDKVTGFITPYWNHLSNIKEGEYYKVYDTGEQISAAKKNDNGKLKALILARGDKEANYLDLDGVSAKKYDQTLGNSVMMNSEASIDMLVHKVVTAINDLYCPNTTLKTDITGTDADGNTVTYKAGTKILDAENCCVGADGQLPPQELFTRTGCDRYTKITTQKGEVYYVYNEEDPTDTALQYTIGSISVNPNLLESESLLPAYKQNGSEERPVAYDLGQALSDLWDKELMYLSPHDTTPVTFSEFYNKMTGELATLGDVFGSVASDLDSTVLTTDNARQQVLGVSSDEELTSMIKYQNAYNAASRFINVISEMIETLIVQMG